VFSVAHPVTRFLIRILLGVGPSAAMAAEIFIQGITKDGKIFRPSDWAERLCGVMSCFRPAGAPAQSHLAYSPYVRPVMVGELKCVVVDERLRQIEPLAYHFVLNFAADNNLVTGEACLVPENATANKYGK
jgi:hypothetical protein